MSAPSSDILVSIVIETITSREHPSSEPFVERLEGTLRAIERQTFSREQIETIVVLDDEVQRGVADELQRRYPSIRIAWAVESNYFAAKNAGARLASGSLIALLDSDCQPSPDWLQTLVLRFQDDVAVVVGSTTYTGNSLTARTFSVPDFANVLQDSNGRASGVMLNNTAFRREVFLSHPLDARIRRNGGCYLLYHQLQADGVRMIYEPRALVAHELDVHGLGFMRKHFDRGYDGVSVYRFDERGLLRGTALFRRLGALALFPITARRIVLDWIRLARKRRQIGIPLLALPYYDAVAAGTRLIELVGGLAAAVASRPGR